MAQFFRFKFNNKPLIHLLQQIRCVFLLILYLALNINLLK
jgi:hypothetical protein